MTGFRKAMITAMLVALLCLVVGAMTFAYGAPTLATNYRQYSYIVIIEHDDTVAITDEQFFDRSAKVVFPVNRTDLPQNDPLLQELETSVIPRLNADSLQLVRMMFRGAASPEGPVALNRQLGQRRVQTLFDWVTCRMAFPVADSLYSIDADIEDYPSLCLMMRRAADPDYTLVKDLCDRFSTDIPLLKRHLQTVRHGQLWQRLLATYFPSLRTARFIIVLRRVRPQQPEPPVVVVQHVDTIAPDTLTIVVPPKAVTLRVPRREVLAVKTNLLFDAAYMPGYGRWCPIPNIAVEYYPLRGHFTLGASLDHPWWQHYHQHKFFQVRNYQLETRYYFKAHRAHESSSPAFSGFYLQAYVHGGRFGICFDQDRGWVGEGLGGGLGLGYVLPLSRNGHWRLDLGLQAGYFWCKYDPYQYENPIDPNYHDDLYYYKWTLKPELFKKRQHHWSWIGPTRIAITLSYDLLYRPVKRDGLSFRSTEVITIDTPQQ